MMGVFNQRQQLLQQTHLRCREKVKDEKALPLSMSTSVNKTWSYSISKIKKDYFNGLYFALTSEGFTHIRDDLVSDHNMWHAAF